MAVTVDKVIERYISLRDEADEIKKRHTEELAQLKNNMTKLEAWLQNHLQTQGLQSFKGTSGTAFTKEVSSATVEDRAAFFDFAINQGNTELLDARCSKTVVDEYVETHGTPPPGVKYSKALIVQVRRS